MIGVDVIILSNIKTRDLTEQTIDTLKNSEIDVDFNVIVIEDSDYCYYNATKVEVKGDFNYNAFMNAGAEVCKNEYIVFCNNDLIFHKGWFTEMLKYDFDCMSPRSMRDFRQWNYIEPIISGYGIGTVFSGWCFMLKRSIWEEIGGLDEDFKFWYADNATVEQLKRINVTPKLITNSFVEHIGSQTLIKEPNNVQEELTNNQSIVFYEKYGRN